MDADLFCEGSIYFYENKSHTKKDYNNPSINQDFIVSRPVYVMPNKRVSFDPFTVNILIITSSVNNRVGIPINIDGYRDGKILPYAFYSVHKDNLVQYMGRASDDIIQEVRDAVAYHTCQSDIKPKYIVEYEEKLKTEEEMLNNMSVKEKSVYTFLQEKCLIKSDYTVKYDELFKAYRKYAGDIGYNRTQDFTRIMNKLISNMTGVELKTKNKVKIFCGLSLNGNVHKVLTEEAPVASKKVSSHKNVKMYENITDVDKLFDLLTSKAQKAYKKLDIIQKIQYYNTPPNKVEFGNCLYDDDKNIIKQMIILEINDRKQKVLDRLASGESPYNMNATEQYLLYICSNTELRKYIQPNFIKSGGLNRLKKDLRKDVKHYFGKLT
jgi:hypothetical protein